MHESLKEKEKAIEDMETRHAEEKEKINFELDVLRSEHLIEVEMLKKELEDVRSKEEKFQLKRGLDFPRRPESEYDSSDVGSRDQSPAVEAMQEQLITIQASYEEEMTSLKEKLQAQIAKTNEAVEKMEQQEFEFNENLSELKSRLDQEQDALIVEHQSELSNVRSMYEERLKLQEARLKERNTRENHEPSGLGSNDVTRADSPVRDEAIAALKAEHEVYMDAVKEQYEGELAQMKQQLQKREKQIANREDQMSDDMMTMHGEYEKQLSDAREEIVREREELQNVVSQLRNEVEELNKRYTRESEEAELRYQKELDGMRRELQEGKELSAYRQENGEKRKEDEDEIKKLKEELHKERRDFTEVRELLEGTITDQEQELARREEVRQKLSEDHSREIETFKEQHEKRLRETSERYQKEIEELKEDHEEELKRMAKGEDSSEDRNREEVGRLRHEIEELKNRHEQELNILHETQESLQAENEELKTEFDLVVNDLSKELENSKTKHKRTIKRSTSPQMVREQLDILKAQNEEEMRAIAEHLDEYKKKVVELEGELENYKEREEESKGDKGRIEELENELGILTQEHANESAILDEYKAEVQLLQNELEKFKEKERELVGVQENEAGKVAELEAVIEELKTRHVSDAEEYERRIIEVQNEKDERKDAWQKEKEDHKNDVSVLERTLEELKEETSERNETLKTQIKASDSRISQLTTVIDDLQDDCAKYQEEKKRLKGEIDDLRKGAMDSNDVLNAQLSSYEEKISQLTKSIMELQQDCANYKEQKLELQEQNDGLRKASYDSKNVLNEQLLSYEEKISQCSKIIEDLENDCRQREKENQILQEEIEQLRNNPNSEPVISSASVQEMFAENPDFIYEDKVPGGLALEYEQQNKELAEEFENKIEDLEFQLSESKNALLSKTKRLESVNAEINALRQNLEEERNVVQNLEERLQKIGTKHEAEIRELKGHLKKEAEQRQSEVSTVESKSKKGNAGNVRNLEAELEMVVNKNTEQAEEIEKLKEELEDKRNSYQAQISTVQYNFEKASSDVESLKATLETASKANSKREQELVKLKEKLEKKTQKHREEMSSTEVKLRQESAATENLKADLAKALKINKKQEDELSRLKEQLQQSVQRTKMEMSGIEDRLKQGYSADMGSLEADLEVALTANSKQTEEIAKLKEQIQELQQQLLQTDANYTAEKIAASEAHALKLQALEQELKLKGSETASLVSLLDAEQKGRERVLLDTEKHLAHVGRTEQEKTTMERELGELRVRVKTLEREIDSETKSHSSTLSQIQKKQQDELEEVLNLNRSFKESEFERGKLVSEIGYWKEESQKVQEKYKKLREKFGLLKDKRREDKEKHAELLLTPRSDMGLQIDILPVAEFEAAKQKVSDSMLEQTRLEEDVDTLEHELSRMRTETQALRKANDILRKQNQILYLETESLKNGSEEIRVDLTQLKEENQLLVKDKDSLTRENRSLTEVLDARERELDRTKSEKTSLDLKNENSQSELRNSEEKQHEIGKENAHLRDENEFLVKQGKRLQFQVEQLENELQKSMRSPALFTEPLQSHSALPLMLESTPETYDQKSLPETKEAKKLVEENQKQHEKMHVLQKLLASKEQELQLNTTERKVLVDGLVKERQELLAQIESMKGALNQSSGDKGYMGIKTYQVQYRLSFI